jgi:hypothetical protein
VISSRKKTILWAFAAPLVIKVGVNEVVKFWNHRARMTGGKYQAVVAVSLLLQTTLHGKNEPVNSLV